jgi:hypothetical protein
VAAGGILVPTVVDATPPTDTGWQPGTPHPNSTYETECGTIAVVTDEYDVEFRERTTGNRTIYEERGEWTVDIYRDGMLVVDDLDVGGHFKAVTVNGETTLWFSGPLIVEGTTQKDTDELAGFGLSNPFYFEHGTFIVEVDEAGETTRYVRVPQPQQAQSLCELVGAA